MFDRASLKQAAKARLKHSGRWTAVLICLLALLLGVFGSDGVSLEFNNGSSSDYPPFGSGSTANIDFTQQVLPILLILFALFVFTTLIVVAVYTFFTNVVTVGFHGWFLRYSRGEEPPITDLFLAFRIYRSSVLTMLLRDVYTFLWSLLFIIPGIIKRYSYYLVPYIIYENPNLSPNEAITLSRTMMDTWKIEVFVFHLSFIGWELLNILTCGILGILYINPYIYTAEAYVYETIKYDAVYTRRVVDPSVFGMPETPQAATSQDDPIA